MANTWFTWSIKGTEVEKPAIDFTGTWSNKLGSVMNITVNDGKITGTYRTNVGAPKPTQEFDLVGFANGDLISFVVSWANSSGDFGSMTAWVGQHTVNEFGTDTIVTMWHLVNNVEGEFEQKDLWSSFLAGSNTFERE